MYSVGNNVQGKLSVGALAIQFGQSEAELCLDALKCFALAPPLGVQACKITPAAIPADGFYGVLDPELQVCARCRVGELEGTDSHNLRPVGVGLRRGC